METISVARRKSKKLPRNARPRAVEVPVGSGAPAEKDRRSFLNIIGTFAGGVVTGVAGSYLTDYAKAADPPEERADRNSSEDPIRALISRERDIGSQGELWVFPYRISSRPEMAEKVLGGFESDDERIQYFFSKGAIDPNVSCMKLIVEGRRHSGVRIIDIRAKIHKRTEPLADCSVLTPGPQGSSPSVMIGFDLDGTETSALRTSAAQHGNVFAEDYFGDQYFVTETVGLTRTEQQVFQITARTVRHYVEWFIEVVLMVDNVEKKYTFGINDEPIRTTALHPRAGFSSPDSVVVPEENRYAEVYVDSRYTDKGQPDGVVSAVFVRKK
jgi:hypothetical protein